MSNNRLFHGGHLGPPENMDINITIHNSYSYEVAIKTMLWLSVTATCAAVLSGRSTGKVENHWPRRFDPAPQLYNTINNSPTSVSGSDFL